MLSCNQSCWVLKDLHSSLWVDDGGGGRILREEIEKQEIIPILSTDKMVRVASCYWEVEKSITSFVWNDVILFAE